MTLLFLYIVSASLFLVVANSVQLKWTDAHELSIGGLAFLDDIRESPYDRFPSSAKAVVAEGVWAKSVESAGVYVEFVTNAHEIWVNFTISESTLSFAGFTTDAHSSVDLFAFDTTNKMYRWIATYENVTYPNASIGVVAHGLEAFTAPTTQFRLNFPLFNRVKSLSIGVDSTILTPVTQTKVNPIVWYGTSIAQGRGAEIPSSAYINQLNLRNHPNLDILNFGFSSNGHMDLEVMQYLNKIDNVKAFVIDCLPNMNTDDVANKTIPLVQSIRESHDYIMPILLVESATYGYEWWNTTATASQNKKRAALKTCYDTLIKSGVEGLYYVEGSSMISPSSPSLTSFAYQVDGTHPTDLGMFKMFSFWNDLLAEMSLM